MQEALTNKAGDGHRMTHLQEIGELSRDVGANGSEGRTARAKQVLSTEE